MAKGKTSVYFCQSCGYESSKWMGQCPGCKEWNTFVEEVIDKKQTEKVRKQAILLQRSATFQIFPWKSRAVWEQDF